MTEEEMESILDKPLPEIVKLIDKQLLLKLLNVAFNAGVKIGQQMTNQALNDALHQKPYLDSRN